MFGQSDTSSFHVITTDHPYMQQLGMTVFSTGTLYEWFGKRDRNNTLYNLRLFGGDAYGEAFFSDENEIDKKAKIGMRTLLDDSNNHYFSAWRNQLKSGKYIKYGGGGQDGIIFNEWSFSDTAKKISYSNESFQSVFSTYNNKIAVLNIQTGIVELIINDNYDSFISNIIEMNNYVINQDPKTATNLLYDQLTRQFIRDIKSSQEKCLQWSVMVPFVLELNVATCTKYEKVDFKLFLYDNNVPKKTERSITVNNPVIVASPKTPTGRSGYTQNGAFFTPNINNPSSNVAAPLRTFFNPFTNQWQSGSVQIIAQIIDDINAAYNPSLKDTVNQTVDWLLNPTNSQQIVVGSAIPISMYDGNPLRWAPEYKLEEGCRQDNKDKYVVKVFNPFPRSWAAGEIVLLNEIYGVWIPSSYGQPTAQQESIDFTDYKWQFTYLMTNSDFYFRNKAKSIVTPQMYEQAVKKLYYHTDALNDGSTIGDYLQYFNQVSLDIGYFQVTSWDFMGSNIGGLRQSNALACTQFEFKPDNEPLENGGKFLEGTQSAPFFGCVFPDGYAPGDKYSLYKSANHPQLNPNNSSSQFFRSIQPSINVFFNKNVNLSSSSAGGMFALSTDSTLKHLPADIALNASMQGVNGAPIRDIQHMHEKLNSITSFNVADFKQNIDNLLTNGYYWMQQGTNSNISAFDFTPINPRKIQFRPLKGEVYATFEHLNYGTVADQSPNALGEFGAYSWNLVSDQQSPISDVAISRNKAGTLTSLNKLWGQRGLKYHASITNPDGSVSNTLPPTAAKFPHTWWNKRNWQTSISPPQYNPPRPAGAIGVITAQCTIKASTKITFTTDNYLGITSWFGQSSNIDLLGPPRPWYASWGGYGGEQIQSMQTTSLFVKVYHAWPREQTLFDPRFFAVFHFNSKSDDLKVKIPSYKDYSNPNAIVEIPKEYYVLQDFIYDQNFKLKGTSESIDENWIKSDTRKGKLLPFKYLTTTISFDLTPDSVYIKKAGSGYTNQDIFATTGGEGVSCELTPTVDNDGRITGFVFKDDNRPMGYKPTDFPKSTDFTVWTPKDGTAKISIIAVSVNKGTGFEGYISRGIVKEITLTDEAPKQILYSTLTPPSKALSDRASAVVDPTDEIREESIDLNGTNSSPDKKYDIFLHYHNDISHTMCHDHTGLGPVALENYSTLTISPL